VLPVWRVHRSAPRSVPQVPCSHGLATLHKPILPERIPPRCGSTGPRPGVDLRDSHVHAPHYRQGGYELMMIILVLAVGFVMLLFLVLLAIVVIGMRQESKDELNMRAPSLFAALARRMLGVYVRKPDPGLDEPNGEPCLSASDTGGGESHCGHTRWSK
jgi:hypothetical protein